MYKDLQITPYFLYIRNFNNAKIEEEIKLKSTLQNLHQKNKFDIDPVSAGMFGLNVGFKVKSGFSCSISAGSMITSLNC